MNRLPNRQSSTPRGTVRALIVLSLLLLPQGCGYFKNIRDDAMDCFMIGAGVVTPVVPTKEGAKGTGSFPPSFGVYVEATELLHLGFLYKVSADIEMDRRGTGIVADRRFKVGVGPIHYIDVQQEPIIANDFKRRGNQMDGWRRNMQKLRDPIFERPGKQVVFDKRVKGGKWWLHRGWQDWEMFSVEIAIPEPFFFHSGINFRVGFDPSQVFDLLLSLVGLDLYGDNAYRANGDLRYVEEDEEAPEKIQY